MSNTYCTFPFTHLNLKQKGKVSACWRYPGAIGEYGEQSLHGIWNDEKIRELRKAFLNNERPKGCKSCWDLEDSGSTSTREVAKKMAWAITEDEARAITRKDYTIDPIHVKCIETRFDNACNLMCRHCSPEYSSQWENAVKKNAELLEETKHNIGSRSFDTLRLTDNVIREIPLFKGITHLMIAGGEPLYHNKHYKFLENLLPNAHNLTLDYNTNMTLIEYKGKSIIDLWKNFKKVDIRVSVDGDRHCYSYVRAKGDINVVEKNLKTVMENLDNLFITMTCTVNNYNITRLDKIFEYFLQLGTTVHTSLVQYPDELNVKVLHKEMKAKITQDFDDYVKLKTSQNISPQKLERIHRYGYNVITYMNSEDRYDQYWDKFVAYTKAQDKYHNTNVLDVYPEFKPYWY